MHSSRMRTVRCSGRRRMGGACLGGVCLGVSAWGCLLRGCLPGGCLPSRCLPSRCLPGGVSARVCVCIPACTGLGVSVPAHAGIHPSPPSPWTTLPTLCTMGKLECVQLYLNRVLNFHSMSLFLQMSQKIKPNKF